MRDGVGGLKEEREGSARNAAFTHFTAQRENVDTINAQLSFSWLSRDAWNYR